MPKKTTSVDVDANGWPPGWTRRVAHAGRCENEAKHTLNPVGYLPWHGWAASKAKAYRQIKCPSCGLYAIWVGKRSRIPMTDEEAMAS